MGIFSHRRFPKEKISALNARLRFKILRYFLPVRMRQWLDVPDRYANWQYLNRPGKASRSATIEAIAKARSSLPKFSVLMPVHNIALNLLNEAVHSVRSQIYEDWELCVFDDGSADARIETRLSSLTGEDRRIRCGRSASSLGISGATNAANEMATGDFIVFLDHDDLMAEDCLAELALSITDDEGVDIWYSDDDKIDMRGQRSSPKFKPGWSPTLLLSYMYFGHVVAIRRSLFNELGGLRSEFDGSQDYDLILRASDRDRHVGHVSKLLYHWRTAPGSTATSGAAKHGSTDAGKRALMDAIDRRGIRAEVNRPEWAERANLGLFALAFPDDGPKVTVIIASMYGVAALERCLQHLAKTLYANVSVIAVSEEAQFSEHVDRIGANIKIVDMGGNSPSLEQYYNSGTRHADADLLLFIRSDFQSLSSKWLSQMMGYIQFPNVGAVGAKFVDETGIIQSAGNLITRGKLGSAFSGMPADRAGYMYLPRVSRECASVDARCILTKASAIAAVGGFSGDAPGTAAMGHFYCQSLAPSGLSTIVCADAHIVDRDHNGTWRPETYLSQAQEDPFYNRNLSAEAPYFGIGASRLPMRGDRQIKVVFVSHNLEAEGAPNTLFDLIEGLTRNGTVHATVLSPRAGPLGVQYEQAGIAVKLFEQPTWKDDTQEFSRKCEALGALFRDEGAEVVLANTLQMFFAVNQAEQEKIGAIWCQHESEPWQTYFRRFRRGIQARAYAAFGQAYRVLYVAEATKAAWSPVRTRENFQVVPYAIPPQRLKAELDRWTRERARAHLLVEDEVVLLTIGTVCKRKGQIDLIRALSHWAMTDAGKIRVYIVGALAEPRYLLSIHQALAKLPEAVRERITLTGAVPDVTLYYAAADAFICCSRVESAPRVLMEAMAFGLPIVTTPVFGIPELVEENRNAIFYQPGSTRQLRDCLLRIVEQPQQRQLLGANGPRILATKPTYDDMIRQYGALIREAAQSADI